MAAHRCYGKWHHANEPYSSVVWALNMKTRGCGFVGLANLTIINSFGWDFQLRSHVTVLYTKHYKEPGSALSSFVLYPCTFLHNNLQDKLTFKKNEAFKHIFLYFNWNLSNEAKLVRGDLKTSI